MQVLLILHAKAAPRESFAETGLSDANRPLTKKGARKFEKAAAGLRQLVDSIDLLSSSPLKRALQKLIQDPLAMRILEGEVLHGDHVMVDVDSSGNKLTFSVAASGWPSATNIRNVSSPRYSSATSAVAAITTSFSQP